MAVNWAASRSPALRPIGSNTSRAVNSYASRFFHARSGLARTRHLAPRTRRGYWAAANLDASELDLYRQHLRRPILDAGCGAGRLLAPLHDEGFDIDGCDTSADMIERCRQRTPDATLWTAPLHQLDPPRRYGSIICSGVLGLGSTREQDIEALHRLHNALLPVGTLVLVNEERPFEWLEREWNEPSGGEISLRTRVDAVDHDDRCVHMTIRAEARDGRREEHVLTMRLWYRDELVPLLLQAGFATVDILPSTDENTFVYVATRQGENAVAG